MRDFIYNQLDIAFEELMSRRYLEAVKRLKSIRLRIVDDDKVKKILDKENQVEAEYNRRRKWLNESEHDSGGVDDIEYVNYLMTLDQWRIREYIAFYTNLAMQYESTG